MTVKELKKELENWDDDAQVKLYIPGYPERLAPLKIYPFELDTPSLVLECEAV